MDPAFGAVDTLPGVPADRAQRRLEAHRVGGTGLAHPRVARCNHRLAVLPAFHHRSTHTGVVCPGEAGRDALPLIRTVESRLDAGLAQLPGAGRAGAYTD